MNRSHSDDHIAFGPATPWERSTFSKLAQRGESEPSVLVIDKSRPARSNSVKAPRPTKRSVTQRSDGSRYRGTPPPEDSMRQHRAQGSFSAQASPRPYETPFFAISTTPVAPSSPPSYTKALPLTPPESINEKSSMSTDKSVSPSKQKVHVLPGTMSARNARSKSTTRQRSAQRKKKPAKVNQWKVVFRQIFRKDPVDETQFEKIEGKHWTDD